MWDKNSVVLLALSPCVLIQNIYVAGLDLGLSVLASFNIAGCMLFPAVGHGQASG